MRYDVRDLATILRAAGISVVETPGWVVRGYADLTPVGNLFHHDAIGRASAAAVTGIMIHGRPDLDGPLCNVWWDREGTAYLIAARRARHAGPGSQAALNDVLANRPVAGDAAALGRHDDSVNGNRSLIGHEVANDGRGEPWPDVQINALMRGLAAICRAYGWGPNANICHREWTARKIDPSWRGDLRGGVALHMLELAGVAAPKPGPPPPPPLDLPQISYSEEDVQTKLVPVALDPGGNGYHDWTPRRKPRAIVGVAVNGSDPVAHKIYSPATHGVNVSSLLVGRVVRTVVQGGPPGGSVGVWVSVA